MRQNVLNFQHHNFLKHPTFCIYDNFDRRVVLPQLSHKWATVVKQADNKHIVL